MGTERLTTVELVVDRVVIQKRDNPIVSFKLGQDELDLRRTAMSRGAERCTRCGAPSESKPPQSLPL